MALQIELISFLSSSKSVCKVPFANLANLTFEVGGIPRNPKNCQCCTNPQKGSEVDCNN